MLRNNLSNRRTFHIQTARVADTADGLLFPGQAHHRLNRHDSTGDHCTIRRLCHIPCLLSIECVACKRGFGESPRAVIRGTNEHLFRYHQIADASGSQCASIPRSNAHGPRSLGGDSLTGSPGIHRSNTRLNDRDETCRMFPAIPCHTADPFHTASRQRTRNGPTFPGCRGKDGKMFQEALRKTVKAGRRMANRQRLQPAPG